MKQFVWALLVFTLLTSSAIGVTGPGEQDASKGKDAPKASVKARGQVRTRDGAPVPKAEVIFEGPKGGNTVTDSSGSFGFEGPAGAYKIRVKAPGKEEQSFQKTIDQGTSLELILQ